MIETDNAGNRVLILLVPMRGDAFEMVRHGATNTPNHNTLLARIFVLAFIAALAFVTGTHQLIAGLHLLDLTLGASCIHGETRCMKGLLARVTAAHNGFLLCTCVLAYEAAETTHLTAITYPLIHIYPVVIQIHTFKMKRSLTHPITAYQSPLGA